jgi:indolepyruvate ferredoxin oxidoreductase beta subunit
VVQFARPGGFLVYYNTVWQPLDVRLGEATEVSAADIQAQCRQGRIGFREVCETGLEDVRMQNMAVLAHIAREGLIPEVAKHHYLLSMEDLMAGGMLTRNRLLFEKTFGEQS